MLKFLLSVIILAVSTYYGGTVTFSVAGRIIEIHIAVFLLIILLLLYVYASLKSLFQKIVLFFKGKPSYEKGIDYLQLAFSGMLLRDKLLVEKSIQKAKKYLGGIPIVSWIEGQLMLANHNPHRAKAIFYELSNKEKETALGAYSICNLAIKERSANEAISAIDSILKTYSHAYELAFQAIVICIRERNYIEAKKYLPFIKKTKKGELVEAIIYSIEGIENNDINLLKKAFKLAPELTENALHYADLLINEKEYKSARKVLLESFKYLQTQKLCKKYISCGEDLSDSDIMKLAEKIMDEVPDSWITHFEFANTALKNDMRQLAFQHFLIAYKKEQYDFIAERLEYTAKIIDETVSLPNPLTSRFVYFVWKCSHCGNEINNWTPVCEHCDWIGEYKYVASEKEESSAEITYNR